MTPSDQVTLTQLPIDEPPDYVDGGPDYNAARAFAEGHGYPPSTIGAVLNGIIPIVQPGEPPAIGYIIKTVEAGFLIVDGGSIETV